MEPLEAAHKIAETDPTYYYDYYGSDRHDCLYCDGYEQYVQDSVNSCRFKHEDDCPWLLTPKIAQIVAAAVHLIDMPHIEDPVGTHHVPTESSYWRALVDALKGE